MRVQRRNLNRRGEDQQTLRVAVLVGIKHERGTRGVVRVHAHQQHRGRRHERTQQHLHVVLGQRHLRAIVAGRGHNPLHLSALNVALVVGSGIDHNQVERLVREEIHEDLHRGLTQNQLFTLGFLAHVALTHVLRG